MWRVNPDDVERCVWDVVRVAKELHSDESRYFRAVSLYYRQSYNHTHTHTPHTSHLTYTHLTPHTHTLHTRTHTHTLFTYTHTRLTPHTHTLFTHNTHTHTVPVLPS